MKAKTIRPNQAPKGQCELLILAGGKILAHNITPDLARVLAALDPQDAAMNRRAQKDNLKS